MQIMDVVDDIRDAIGDKGLWILLTAVGGLFIYNLTKSSGVQVVEDGSGYADADRNADVIISTIQKNLEYQTGEITDYIDGVADNFNQSVTDLNQSYDNLSDRIDQNFKDTNNMIQDGFASQDKLLSINFDKIFSGIDSLEDTINNSASNIIDVSNKNTSFITNSIGGVASDIKQSGSIIKDLQNGITHAINRPSSSLTTPPKNQLATSTTNKRPAGTAGTIVLKTDQPLKQGNFITDAPSKIVNDGSGSGNRKPGNFQMANDRRL